MGDEKSKQAAIKLGQQLRDKPWFSSVGIAEEEGHPILIVYLVRHPGKDQKMVPDFWEGIPVRSRKIAGFKGVMIMAAEAEALTRGSHPQKTRI